MVLRSPWPRSSEGSAFPVGSGTFFHVELHAEPDAEIPPPWGRREIVEALVTVSPRGPLGTRIRVFWNAVVGTKARIENDRTKPLVTYSYPLARG